MVELMEKAKVIMLKNEGFSNREVARRTGLHRETVSKYWEEYKQKLQELSSQGVDEKRIQEELVAAPKYDASNRKPRKYTEEIENRLKEILESERKKDLILGARHKQAMTNVQIHGILVAEGFDISLSTINVAVRKLRQRQKQVFIRQQYEFGDRVEYDFGEVRLVIGGELGTYHMALLAEPSKSLILRTVRPCRLPKNMRRFFRQNMIGCNPPRLACRKIPLV